METQDPVITEVMTSIKNKSSVQEKKCQEKVALGNCK